MEFGLEEIKKYLPHREPFLFVDKVLTLNPGKDISGSIKFNDDSFFFKGHFPNRPVVPGVIIIESLAQLGGLLIYKSFEKDLLGKDPALIAVDSAKFKYARDIVFDAEALWAYFSLNIFFGGTNLASETSFELLWKINFKL